MNKYAIVIIIIGLVSCSKQHEQPHKLRLKNFVWSAYTWVWNDTLKQHQFYLGHYVEVKPDGHCFIMRHDAFQGQPTYYQINLNDALLNKMNAAFAKGIDSSRYWQSRSDSTIIAEYDQAELGKFYYCFDYSTPDNKPQFFKYYRKLLGHYLDDRLYQMHFQLETLAYNPKLVKTTARPENPYYDGYAIRLKEKLNERILPQREISSKDVIFIPPPPIKE